MRHPLPIAVSLVTLAGCGSSDSSEKLTGRAFGAPFTPIEVAYVGPLDASCEFPVQPPVPYANSAVLIGFSTTPGLCDVANNPCTGRKDLTFIAGTIAHAKLASTAAPGLEPGTFTVYADPTTAAPDANLEIRAAILSPFQTSATCAQTQADPGSGTIQVDVVSQTELRGHVDVTFPDGGFLLGPFVATPCETTFDVCAGSLRACEGTPTCP